MKVYLIKTTAYREEDFLLLTDLVEQEITEVINPIVMAERDGYEEYYNEDLVDELKKRYPKNNIIMIDDIEELVY